jgi:ubiquinone/menaquinone biosynthesis C-methylase UbiE
MQESSDDSRVQSICESYDRLAQEYANRLFDELQHKPLDRELLQRLAREVGRRGEICDMGCGPGHVARFLRDSGASVFGLDLSPEMLQQARKLNPDIAFRQGNMLALDLPSASLAGIAAFYAIVNIPTELHGTVFREMARVLQPGGPLLLAFHVGDEMLAVDELWGQKITMNFFLFPTSEIRLGLEEAGLQIEEVVERDPYPDVEHQSRRAYILARKPIS